MPTMYAQVEQALAMQDYAPFRPCIRLVSVDAKDFEDEAYNSDDGCRTHMMDIAWDQDFWRPYFIPDLENALGKPFFLDSPPPKMLHDALEAWPADQWIQLDYTPAIEPTGAYLYGLFEDEDPLNISVEFVRLLTGPAVTPPPLAVVMPSIATHQTFEVSAFHVGQGMCSLVYGQHDGVLLDAGAGVPMVRTIYRDWLKAPGSVVFRNELHTRMQGLHLQVIISHPDSDHWRLLDWDPSLFAATTHIFTPAGAASLALKSSRAIAKVTALAGTTTVSNGQGGPPLLDIHRSSPAWSDRNGECLVVETHTGPEYRHHCLFPGDYVYDRMVTDSVSAIASLSSATLDAVMVPHHGDAASASVRVLPRIDGKTVAFFSAGTHRGYGHPTKASTQAHSAAGFLNVDRHAWTDIIEHRLP